MNAYDEFVFIAMVEQRMPCHKTVNYEAPDWRTKQDTAPQCAGRATMWANTSKLPRRPDLLRVQADRETVFSNIREFAAHHEKDAKAVKGRRLRESGG